MHNSMLVIPSVLAWSNIDGLGRQRAEGHIGHALGTSLEQY